MAKEFAITSFEEAMGQGYSPKAYHDARRYAGLYAKWNYTKVTLSKTPLIPKKLHQIWIGGKPPERFLSMMESWKICHPDWEYKLWTDEDIASFPFAHPEVFHTAINLGAKSDIWRYEILYQFGGVYVDTDFECMRSLDPLIYAHKFFVGIGGFDYVNNAIIGSAPHHPLLEKVNQVIAATAPHTWNDPWQYTGPLMFSRQVYSYLKGHPEDGIVYPTAFFYPFPNELRHEYWSGKIEKEQVHSYFIPETFAVHYWAGTWK